MTRSHAVLPIPFVIALLAVAFCIWSALGNDVNFCVTTGCTLYQDFTVAGISLWWFGAAAFTLLAACALMGQAVAGRWLASFFVFCDAALLLLMVLTAPCISCLVAGALFALCYLFFRRYGAVSSRPNQKMPLKHSPLLWVWLAFFIINLGQVARSQLDVWAILNESDDPRVRMFFSPSCKYCIEGIKALSGNVDVAFYPVAETESDVFALVRMSQLLEQGSSMSEAIAETRETEPEGFFASLRPDILLLRFRLLRNKAHIFASGSQGVPFFEYRGLPPDIQARMANDQKRRSSRELTPKYQGFGSQSADHRLPLELQDGTQCGGRVPCPPANP